MRRRCAELDLQSVPVQLRMFGVFADFLRSLLGVRRSTPKLVVLAETAQLPILMHWRTRLLRFWNSVIAVAEGSLLQRATIVRWRRSWAAWPLRAAHGLGRCQLPWPLWAWGSA